MSERHPTRIGKYEVECVIGEGAMGVVYRAVDPVINRRVAIKVMTDAVAQDVGLRERFLREAQAAGSLQHPNVVTIYDFGEVDEHLYIAMEYVEGDDLADLLTKKVSIPIAEALDLVIGLLHGLAYAHKRGIIHRDVKPANIRVDTEGKARLMDFGVAHLASSEMTSTGVLLGTPSYMAPEQITGAPITPETDLFSVGAVLYELIAQRRPFESGTLQSLMYQILNKTPEPLDGIVTDMPAGLNNVVMRALEKEQSQRYHSALAMANDLAAIRDSLDPEGKRTSTSLRATIDTALANEHRARHRRKREWQVATFAAGVFVAAFVFAGARLLLRDRSSTSPRTEAAPSTGAASPRAPDSARLSATIPPIAIVPQATTAPAPSTSAANPPSSRAATPDTRQRTAPSSVAAPPTSTVVERSRVDSSTTASVQTVPRVSPPVDRTPSVAQQPSVATAPVVTPLPAPPSAATQAPRENASDQIAAVIAAYARALQSRDIGELRRVYPSVSADQRRAFEDFFHSTRSLTATLAVAGLQVDGAAADAQVSGSFDYVTTSGANEHRAVSFRAALRLERGAWILTAVR